MGGNSGAQTIYGETTLKIQLEYLKRNIQPQETWEALLTHFLSRMTQENKDAIVYLADQLGLPKHASWLQKNLKLLEEKMAQLSEERRLKIQSLFTSEGLVLPPYLGKSNPPASSHAENPLYGSITQTNMPGSPRNTLSISSPASCPGFSKPISSSYGVRPSKGEEPFGHYLLGTGTPRRNS